MEMREIASVVPGLFFIVVPSMAKVINNYNRGGVSQSEPPECFFNLIVFFSLKVCRQDSFQLVSVKHIAVPTELAVNFSFTLLLQEL